MFEIVTPGKQLKKRRLAAINWNAKSFNHDSFIAMIKGNAYLVGTREHMSPKVMSVVSNACDVSMAGIERKPRCYCILVERRDCSDTPIMLSHEKRGTTNPRSRQLAAMKQCFREKRVTEKDLSEPAGRLGTRKHPNLTACQKSF